MQTTANSSIGLMRLGEPITRFSLKNGVKFTSFVLAFCYGMPSLPRSPVFLGDCQIVPFVVSALLMTVAGQDALFAVVHSVHSSFELTVTLNAFLGCEFAANSALFQSWMK